MKCICIKCGLVAEDYEHKFWKKNMGLKEKDPYSSYCKECSIENIDLQDITTFKPLCKELNIPYVEKLIYLSLNNKIEYTKRMIVGKYIARMRLLALYPFHYEDSDIMNERMK